jgi:hypothetical protein
MQQKTTLHFFILSPLFFISTSLFAFVSGPDTCTVNDDCQQAIIVQGVVSDQEVVCINGCNLFASPETDIQSCFMSIYPTVWYAVTMDEFATVLNIQVYSSDIDNPTIALFRSFSGCSNIEQVELPGGNFECVIGADGVAKAIGTRVDKEATYYIAISSMHDIGGNFNLCLSTFSSAFNCVLDRSIEIKARSNGGPLEGPFDPEEKVSFCLNVYEYTAANNGCQWFQGLVPVFGNGWDPSSFTSDGQPLGTFINNDTIGKAGNGLYGTSIWDWFTDVDYHHDRPHVNVGDHDNNGTLDMCNSQYELDCPNGSINGGCCNPCWGTSLGTILPGGWFAYGINGSCSEPGPPVRVDWGDGNSCGGPMGPWSFCFDLTTRSLPDCMTDSTKTDLSIGFYTFADGETGAWTGSGSVCALDLPVKLSLQAKCGRINISDLEHLPPLCTGEVLQYQIEDPTVSHWEWNISPYTAVPYPINYGENGFDIEAPLVNNTDAPIDIQGTLIGYVAGSTDKIVRQFTFQLDNAETCGTTSTTGPEANQKNIRVYPVPASDRVNVEWALDVRHTTVINIYNIHGALLKTIPVSLADGRNKQIDISDLASGVYWISLQSRDFKHVVKMTRM